MAPSAFSLGLLLRNSSIVPGERPVLVLPRETGALVGQSGGYRPLYVVGHLVAGLAAAAGELERELVEEGNLVGWTGVHEEEEGVHPLPPPRRGAVEHAHSAASRHRHDLVRELREQRREAQQEGLAAGRPLGADRQVALPQELPDHGGIAGAVAAEAHGTDGGEYLGEAGDGVGDGGDRAAEGDGEEDGVQEGAVGADEEDAGMAEGRGGRGRRGAADGDADAESAEDVVDVAHGEEGPGGDAETGDEEARREPEDGNEGQQRRWLLDQAAVVEDDRLRQLVTGDGPASGFRWHHIRLLCT